MTDDQLPISIKETIASHTTCTSDTVIKLKHLLFPPRPDKPTQHENKTAGARLPRQRVQQSTRNDRGQAKKTTDVKVHECRPTSEDESGRGKLAAEVLNVLLKSFTEAVKTRSSTQELCVKKRSIRLSLNAEICSPKSQPYAPNPLQPICANIVSSGNGQSKESQRVVCSDEAKAASGFYAQAECARLAFSALNGCQTYSDLAKRLPALRLENAMCTLVNKFFALDLFEPAYRQLLALKKSILAIAGETKISNLVHERVGPKEGMIDLLRLPLTNIKGSLLAIAATFELQVLRLIAAKYDATHLKAVMDLLQLTNPHSPIRLIQAQYEPTDTATHAKPAQQLEALSRLLFSICSNAPSSEDRNCKLLNQVDPLTAFRFQLLALKLRSLWWDLAGHKGNVGKDLVEPFGRYLSTFHRRCAAGLADGYNSAKCFLADMVLLSQGENVPPAVSLAFKTVWRSIYTELIEICRQCCLNDEAEVWLERWTNMPAADEDSPCRQCIVTCQKAVLYARISIDRSRETNIVTALANAQQHLEGDLSGGSEDLDELLRVVVNLRKTAASFLNMSRTPLESHRRSLSAKLIRQCYIICSSCVCFLCQYIGKRPLQCADHLSSQRYQQRLEQALPFIQVFTDTVVSIARLTKGDGPDDWIDTHAGLQACLSLAALASNSQDINASPSICVQVSNTYWIRYLHMKQSNSAAKEVLQALKASIDAVEHCAIADKHKAQLQTRLEHYGNLLEHSRDYSQAIEIYKHALRTHVEMGNLQKAAAAAATQPISTVFIRQSDIASLGRVLIAYLRVATRIGVEAGFHKMIDGDNKLEASQRGLALEYQLSSLSPQLTVGAVTPQIRKAVVSLATELLDLYSMPLFPVRRLRVVDSLMWFRTVQPHLLTSNLMEKLDGLDTDPTTNQPNGLDSGLERLLPYLNASRDAVSAIREACLSRKQRKVKNAVSCWYHIVEESPDLEALEQRLGDVAAWLLRLELLSQYLDACGLDMQRRSVLEVMSIVREKYYPSQHQELLLSLTRLGLQHLRLGYAKQGGLAFHKAMRYVSPVETAKEVAIWFYVAYAEYFLFSENIGRCKENLTLAQEMFEKSGMEKQQKPSSHGRFEVVRIVLDAASLYSSLAGRSGQYSNALKVAKQGLRYAHKAWTSTEQRQAQDKFKGGSMDELVDPTSNATISDNNAAENRQMDHGAEPAYWSLVPQLHRAYLEVARVYASKGMFTEAKYYLEKSQKLAENALAGGLLSRSLDHLADLLTHGEHFEEANKLFDIVRGQFGLLEEDQHHIQLQANLANFHLAKAQTSDAEGSCAVAESIIERVVNENCKAREQPDVVALQEQLSGITIGKKASHPIVPKKRPLQGICTNEASIASNGISTKVNSMNTICTQVSLSPLRRSRYKILVLRLQLAIRQDKLELAAELLSEAAGQLFTPQDTILYAMLSAEISMGRGLNTLKSDPVYCVLPESTVSLPSVLQEKPAQPINPPIPSGFTKAGRKPGKPGLARNGNKRVQNAPKVGQDCLAHEFRQAQVDTSKVCQLAVSVSPSSTLRRLSKIMTEILLNLSALNSPISEERFAPSPSVLLSVTGMS